MHTTKTLLAAFIAGIGLLLFLAGFLLSGLSAALASMQGSGAGSCSPAVSTTPAVTVTRVASPSPAPTGTAPVCVPPGGVGKQVVAWARAMAAALYVNPARATLETPGLMMVTTTTTHLTAYGPLVAIWLPALPQQQQYEGRSRQVLFTGKE
ncbi:MAG: hypothetical protein ACYDER_02915 [Ktedonobacteraceae bacterium]